MAYGYNSELNAELLRIALARYLLAVLVERWLWREGHVDFHSQSLFVKHKRPLDRPLKFACHITDMNLARIFRISILEKAVLVVDWPVCGKTCVELPLALGVDQAELVGCCHLLVVKKRDLEQLSLIFVRSLCLRLRLCRYHIDSLVSPCHNMLCV